MNNKHWKLSGGGDKLFVNLSSSIQDTRNEQVRNKAQLKRQLPRQRLVAAMGQPARPMERMQAAREVGRAKPPPPTHSSLPAASSSSATHAETGDRPSLSGGRLDHATKG